jgi:hypothetical protein
VSSHKTGVMTLRVCCLRSQSDWVGCALASPTPPTQPLAWVSSGALETVAPGRGEGGLRSAAGTNAVTTSFLRLCPVDLNTLHAKAWRACSMFNCSDGSSGFLLLALFPHPGHIDPVYTMAYSGPGKEPPGILGKGQTTM